MRARPASHAPAEHHRDRGLAGDRLAGRTMLAAVLAGATCIALSSCGSHGVTLYRPSPLSQVSSTPGSTPSPTAESGYGEILRQYSGFWAALTPASRSAEAGRREMLAKYADDPELTSLLAGMARESAKGRAYYGAPDLHPQVASLSTDHATAVVNDCQDATKTGDVDVQSGQQLTKGSPRTSVVATLHMGSDAIWRVTFISFPSRQC